MLTHCADELDVWETGQMLTDCAHELDIWETGQMLTDCAHELDTWETGWRCLLIVRMRWMCGKQDRDADSLCE